MLEEIVTFLCLGVQYVGMRVSQVYDVDNKTYLIKLQKPDAKEL